MNANSIANTAFSALQSAQAGLALTSQNVEGQSVSGYTRRRLEAGTSQILANGLPTLGSGVSVSGYGRDWSALLQQQRVGQAGVSAFHGAVADGLASLDGQAADPALAFDVPVNNFFSALATLARNPKDASALSALKAQGTVLLASARHFETGLGQVQQAARARLADGVAQLNRIGAELAVINRDIGASQSSGGPGPAAAVLDRRDALLLEAGGLVGGDLGLGADGQAYVFVDGQPLVNGAESAELLATPLSADPKAPLGLSMRFGVPGQEPAPMSVALRGTSLQGSIGGQWLLAADPSLVLQPGGQTDPKLAPFTDLFAATNGEAGAGASLLTTALAALDRFNHRGERTAAQTQSLAGALDEQLQALAARANSTDAATGGPALQAGLLSAWRAFEGNLGAQVSLHQSGRTASAAVESRLEADYQSQSGVNLDEEAANLLRYQQAYSAASKLLQTNATLLDDLLAIVSR